MDAGIFLRASEIVRTYKLCNHCLGKLFLEVDAETNEERGRKIRDALGNSEPETCDMCSGFFKRTEEIAWAAAKRLASSDARTILVSSKVPKRVLLLEEEIWEKYDVQQSESIKKDINRTIGEKLEQIGGWRYDPEDPDARIAVDLNGKVTVEVQPIYITAEIIAPPPKKREAKEKVRVAAEAIFGAKDVKLRTKCWKEGNHLIVEIVQPLRRYVSVNTFSKTLGEMGINYIRIGRRISADCTRKYLEGEEC